MKNFIYVAIVVVGFSTVQAQVYTPTGTVSTTTNPTTTNIGVGISTPVEKLQVNGNIQGLMGLFTNSQATQTFASATDRNYKCTVLSAGTLLNSAQRARTFQFFDFPQSSYDAAPTVWFSITDRNNFTRFRVIGVQGASSTMNLYDKAQAQSFSVSDDGNNNVTLSMPKANSFVGIGTTSFTDGTDIYKLSVAGNIRAQRVKVYTTWADYVFEDGYKLPTLEEVEKHIKEKGHLQDIPSAADVEAKGIELGEMNKLLLQKIEELTLYTIELNKQVQELKVNSKK